jgi:hypothetical protein
VDHVARRELQPHRLSSGDVDLVGRNDGATRRGAEGSVFPTTAISDHLNGERSTRRGIIGAQCSYRHDEGDDEQDRCWRGYTANETQRSPSEVRG